MAKAELKIHSGRIPPVPRLVRVALALILLSIAASVMNDRSFKTGGVSLIWLSNGFLIGVLLCAPKRQWPAFVTLGYAIDFCLNVVQVNGVPTSAFFSFCNMTEVVVAATLMYSRLGTDPDLTEATQLRSLILYGVLVAPAIESLLVAVYLRVTQGAAFSHSARSWFAADALGIAMATPLYLSNHYGRKFSPRSNLEAAGLLLLVCLVSLGVFRLTDYPMLWVVLLFLLLLGARLGFTGSAPGLLLVTFIGGYLTVEGFGPLGSNFHGSIVTRVFVFQLFIGLSMLALYVTEVAMSASRRVVRRLEASETRFRSLAEASRDVIILAELSGRRQYVSPAMTELLGWRQEELVDQHYTKIVHLDDVPRVQQFMQQLREGGEMSPLVYRCSKRDGSYLWLEATSRLLRYPESEEPYGFVHVLRDISDRKAAEEQMQEAFQTVERLALIDGLTGVANRRLLDQTLAREWISSRRDKTPLSVLLIDVDLFKSFNDHYGHMEGDQCLCRVATKMQAILRRPLDLLARYGGEEFVAVLPNTPAEGAKAMAEMLRKVVEDCAITHRGSPHGLVTVSVGFATEIPTDSSNLNSLLNTADTALYRAKSSGRNRTQAGSLADMSLK
jgi:diguanylate cyclase (GGDEF)-like protein/PAS domain S-box-containing protein